MHFIPANLFIYSKWSHPKPKLYQTYNPQCFRSYVDGYGVRHVPGGHSRLFRHHLVHGQRQTRQEILKCFSIKTDRILQISIPQKRKSTQTYI
jgi:hypothetical protein